MPPKKEDRFSVVYLKKEVEGCLTRIIVAPSNWIKDDSVTYSTFPLSENDTEAVNSFLLSSTKQIVLPPELWPKYECLVLEFFATLNGALNKMKKLQEDEKVLQALIKRANKEDALSKKGKSVNQLIITLNNEIEESIQKLPALPEINMNPVNIKLLSNQLHLEPVQTNAQDFALNGSDSFENPIADDCKTSNGDDHQEQYLLLNSNDFQSFKNQMYSIVSQLHSTNTKIDTFMLIINTIKVQVDTLTSAVQNLTGKLQKEKFAAIDVSKKLQELHTVVVDKRPLKENEKVLTFDQLLVKHGLQSIPFNDVVNFIIFEERLASDSSLREDLRLHFLSTIAAVETALYGTMIIIFKAFFTKVVMGNFIAQKSKQGRITLKSTSFYKTFKDAVNNIFGSSFDEKLFLSKIGEIIKNSADWEGRVNRNLHAAEII